MGLAVLCTESDPVCMWGSGRSVRECACGEREGPD